MSNIKVYFKILNKFIFKKRSGLQPYFFILGMIFFALILNQYFHFDRAGDGFSFSVFFTSRIESTFLQVSIFGRTLHTSAIVRNPPPPGRESTIVTVTQKIIKRVGRSRSHPNLGIYHQDNATFSGYNTYRQQVNTRLVRSSSFSTNQTSNSSLHEFPKARAERLRLEKLEALKKSWAYQNPIAENTGAESKISADNISTDDLINREIAMKELLGKTNKDQPSYSSEELRIMREEALQEQHLFEQSLLEEKNNEEKSIFADERKISPEEGYRIYHSAIARGNYEAASALRALHPDNPKVEAKLKMVQLAIDQTRKFSDDLDWSKIKEWILIALKTVGLGVLAEKGIRTYNKMEEKALGYKNERDELVEKLDQGLALQKQLIEIITKMVTEGRPEDKAEIARLQALSTELETDIKNGNQRADYLALKLGISPAKRPEIVSREIEVAGGPNVPRFTEVETVQTVSVETRDLPSLTRNAVKSTAQKLADIFGGGSV